MRKITFKGIFYKNVENNDVGWFLYKEDFEKESKEKKLIQITSKEFKVLSNKFLSMKR